MNLIYCHGDFRQCQYWPPIAHRLVEGVARRTRLMPPMISKNLQLEPVTIRARFRPWPSHWSYERVLISLSAGEPHFLPKSRLPDHTIGLLADVEGELRSQLCVDTMIGEGTEIPEIDCGRGFRALRLIQVARLVRNFGARMTMSGFRPRLPFFQSCAYFHGLSPV